MVLVVHVTFCVNVEITTCIASLQSFDERISNRDIVRTWHYESEAMFSIIILVISKRLQGFDRISIIASLGSRPACPMK